jgi:hypothetical protein
MDALRKTLRLNFFAHRLNNSEFVRATEALREAERGRTTLESVAELIDHFSSARVDEREPVTLAEVRSAVRYLKLDQRLKALTQDAPWSSTQRAMYRRLTHLEHDPVPLHAQGTRQGNKDFVHSAQHYFEAFDLDGSGDVSNPELDRVMSNPQLAGREAATAVAMRVYSRYLIHCNEDGPLRFTRKDLEIFGAQGIPDDSKTTYKLNSRWEMFLQQAQEMCPAGPLEAEDFSPRSVRQGRAGSCVLLATLKNQETVRSMFTAREDGFVDIHLADGSTQTVKDLTPAERLYHAQTLDGGRWPGLLEMAVGQRLHALEPEPDGSARSGANGIPVEEASLAMTGHASNKIEFSALSPNKTRELLVDLQQLAKPWVCGSRAAPRGKDSKMSVEELQNGVANNHAYRFVEYDPKTDLVSLQNPWHRGEWAIRQDGSDDGDFHMPFLDFYTSYRWVSGPGLKAA